MRRLLPSAFLPCLLPLCAAAQSLHGTVRDAETGVPLPGVTVALPATGTATRADGRFRLDGLPAGTHTLRLSAVGYETARHAVAVPAADTLAFRLRKTIILLHNEVNVTARRFEDRTFDAPQAVSVLSGDYIRQAAPRTTPDLLAGTTGVFVQKTSHGGGSPIVRGLMGNQVLLLLDGIRLNNATYRYGPNQYLATVDPLLLDRVEVVRGAGSVLYGSDALGGVVQLMSRQPRPPADRPAAVGTRVFGKWTSAGMERTGRAEVEAGGRRISFLGGFSARHFGDLLAGGPLGFQGPSGYRERAADARLLVRTSARSLLTASYQYLHQTDVPVYYRVAQDKYTTYQFAPQARALGYLRWQRQSDNRWLQAVRLTASRQRTVEGLLAQRQDSPLQTTGRDEVSTWGGTAEIHSRPMAFWRMQSGVDYYRDHVGSRAGTTDTRTGGHTARRGNFADGSVMASLAVFSSHVLDWPRFQATGGLRYNAVGLHVRDEALRNPVLHTGAWVGQVSGTYKLRPAHHLVAGANTGFRAPNLDDVSKLGHVEANIYETPNARLSPERTRTLEAGYRFRSGRFSGSATAYRTRLAGQIVRVKAGTGGDTLVQGIRVYTKANSAESRLWGGEAEAEMQVAGRWVAFGNVAYVYGQDRTRNEPMRRIPPLFGRAGLRGGAGRFDGRVEYLFAGRQARLAAADRADVRIASRLADGATPAWHVANLYAGYTHRHFQVQAGLQNLFDAAYRTHGSGIDGTGRSVWLALRIHTDGRGRR